MNGKRIVLPVLAVVGIGIGYYFYGGHATPKGQPPLVRFSAGDLAPLQAAFNNSASSVRLIVMLSPT
jgi:hypothetical protein